MRVYSDQNSATKTESLRLNPNAFREFERVFVPEGHRESSPAFQRREHVGCGASPEGTVETPFPFAFQPSLRDSNRRGCEPSVETRGYCRLSLRDSRGQTQSEFPKGIRLNPALMCARVLWAYDEPRQRANHQHTCWTTARAESRRRSVNDAK